MYQVSPLLSPKFRAAHQLLRQSPALAGLREQMYRPVLYEHRYSRTSDDIHLGDSQTGLLQLKRLSTLKKAARSLWQDASAQRGRPNPDPPQTRCDAIRTSIFPYFGRHPPRRFANRPAAAQAQQQQAPRSQQWLPASSHRYLRGICEERLSTLKKAARSLWQDASAQRGRPNPR
jgi:hypothetical protein